MASFFEAENEVVETTPYVPIPLAEEKRRQEESEKATVISALKNSYVFGYSKSTETYIRERLESSKEPIKSIVGWDALKIRRKNIM